MKDQNFVVNKNLSLSEDLFEEIYSSYKNKIFNFAYKMIGNRSIAEDITQETFIQVYRNYRSFKGKSKLLTWIYTIAKNFCFQHLKKTKKSSFQLLEHLINNNINSDEINKYEYLEKKLYVYQVKEGCLLGLLRCLSFNQRLAFILNILFEISIKDVSAIINKSENSTRILIYRARNNLKKFLCKNCSLYDNKNKCRCENLISFSLKQNWIKKYEYSVPRHTIETEIKEFKNEILLYKTLKNYDLNKKISEIIDNKNFFIFSEKKVK